MGSAGPTPEFVYKPLNSETRVRGFRCGEYEIDQWLSKEGLKCDGRGTVRVHCMHLKSNDTLIGYFAIATAVENIKKLKGFHYHAFGEGRWFPCLHLVNVAVRDRYKGRDLGKILVGTAITIFAEIGPAIGLPHMILTPINSDVIPFYEALGFKLYDNGERMYLPLQTAVQVVEQERARKAQIDAAIASPDGAEPPIGANDSGEEKSPSGEDSLKEAPKAGGAIELEI